MYIKRSIEQDMLKWKNTKEHNVLEIRGARQVGKTTTIEHFCYENYKNVLCINIAAESGEWFLETVNSCKNFHHVPTVLDFLTEYSKRFKIAFINTRDTVVIFDEIQESQKVYEMIRPFHRELQCDVIVTGSYLNKALKYFQPAGDVDILTMYPISFPEFIQCFEQYKYYDSWKNEIVDNKILGWLEKAYELYAEIGGYPLAVSTFLDGSSLTDVEKIHKKILNMLFSELRVRMGSFEDYEKLTSVLFSIINIMIREKKGDSKLIERISRITENYGSFRVSIHECYSLIAWLKEAGFLEFCNKVKLPEQMVQSNARIFFADLGILSYLCHKYEIDASVINGIRNETFVFKSLNERDFSEEFYGDGPAFAMMNEYKIDFYVSSKDKRKYGIEVKSGKNTGKSVQEALKSYAIDYAVYFKGNCNYGQTGNVITVPLCMAYKFRYDFGGTVEDSRNTTTVSVLTSFN